MEDVLPLLNHLINTDLLIAEGSRVDQVYQPSIGLYHNSAPPPENV